MRPGIQLGSHVDALSDRKERRTLKRVKPLLRFHAFCRWNSRYERFMHNPILFWPVSRVAAECRFAFWKLSKLICKACSKQHAGPESIRRASLMFGRVYTSLQKPTHTADEVRPDEKSDVPRCGRVWIQCARADFGSADRAHCHHRCSGFVSLSQLCDSSG